MVRSSWSSELDDSDLALDRLSIQCRCRYRHRDEAIAIQLSWVGLVVVVMTEDLISRLERGKKSKS
jgi:hypothetical protein